MGLFDKLKRGKSNLTIDAIIGEEYEQQYFDECKYIWKNYVPQAGQADKLQGELLREIEKIRCEAQDNENINWDIYNKDCFRNSVFIYNCVIRNRICYSLIFMNDMENLYMGMIY